MDQPVRHPAEPSGPVEYDPASVAGKQPPIADETDLLVIGAGRRGLLLPWLHRIGVCG